MVDRHIDRQIPLIIQSAAERRAVNIKHLSKVDAAYIAGLIDGEGTVGVYRNKPRGKNRSIQHRVTVFIVNTDLDVLLWVREATGAGTVTSTTPSGFAEGRRKICYRWAVYFRVAEALLQQCEPYLHIKKGKARAALNLYKLIRRTHAQGAHRTLTAAELRERDIIASAVSTEAKYLN